MDDLCPSPPPDAGQAAYVRGLTLLRDGDAIAAIPCLEHAVRQQPDHPGRRRNLVRALLATHRCALLLHHAEAGLRLAPSDPEMHFARGAALSALGQPIRALAAFTQAIALRPAHAPSWLNLANSHADLDDLAAAESHCRKAIDLDPALPEAHASLAYFFTRQGRPAEAIAACDTALRLSPGFPQAAWNRSIALLLSGDLPAGFAAYECRKTHPRFHRDFRPLPGPQWDGSDPAGRTILIRTEQGAGDTIQFARYLPRLRDSGATAIIACATPLLSLIRRIPGIHAVSMADPLPHYDAWTDQITLPRLFSTTLHSIPAAAGYLHADPARVAAWRQRLPAGTRIGLAFAGNPAHTGDRHRSIPPALLRPLLDTPGLAWINLQHGAAAAGIALPDLSRCLPDFAETAALIQAVDLVVTVDTAVAHLAGALGKPTWILLPHAPDWRWLLHRSDSPWYAAVTLYRQRNLGDWPEVIARVHQDLRHAPLRSAEAA